MDSSRELWHNLEYSWFVEQKLPVLKEDELLIESLFSLISLGTELTITTQKLSEEVAEKMEVPYMKGGFHNDFTYGYSLVGRVILGPKDKIGKLVHVMHPHQDYVLVKERDVFYMPLKMSPKLATLASNMETAINAIWDARIEVGDKVLVIGYGTVGSLTALIAQNIPGVEVTILENNKDRSRIAEQRGLKVNLTPENGFFDLVFNTSGSEEMLQKAVSLTKHEGKIIEMSWFGSKSIQINLGSDFHYGRKQIISSQVSHLPNRKSKNWSYFSRKTLVFKLLEELNPHFLIDEEISFSEVPKFYNKLRKKKPQGLGIVIKY